MNKHLVVLALALVYVNYSYGTILEPVQIIFSQPATYGENNVWVGLELINKSKDRLWVMAKNGDNATEITEVPATYQGTFTTVHWNIDIKKPTSFAIWYKKKPVELPASQKEFIILRNEPSYKPTPDMLYRFTPNKTIYVTWDDRRGLRPQTGTLAGWSGKTNTNLSMGNNVQAADILDITPESAEVWQPPVFELV